MPSPEFHRSFPIGRTIFVLTFQMRSVVPIRGGSNQSTMSKYYPITTRLRKLITLPPPFMRTVTLDGVRNSRFPTFNQKSSNKEMTTYNLQIETYSKCVSSYYKNRILVGRQSVVCCPLVGRLLPVSRLTVIR